MNLTNLKNYLNLVNPSDNYRMYLKKDYTRGEVISIQYLCTLLPRQVRISKDENDELILEAESDELNLYFPWLLKVLKVKYLKSIHYGTFGNIITKVYRITMKD